MSVGHALGERHRLPLRRDARAAGGRAGETVERPVKAATSAEHGWWDGILPDCWPLIEGPADAEASTDYWLPNLPDDASITNLVRLAKP